MNEKTINETSIEEQRKLSSEYRKTAHANDIIFINDDNQHSLTSEEVKQKLLNQRDELLKMISNSACSNDIDRGNKRFSQAQVMKVKQVKDTISSGIIGFAVGDALGVPIEFLDRSVLIRNPLKDMIGFGSHNVPEGTWSDDTSLMIATMDSIIEKNDIDYDDILNKFSEWYCSAKYTATDKLFDIGISTRKAINNYLSNSNIAVKCGVDGIRENGNGSLMRILPIAYYIYFNEIGEEDKTEIINNVSSLTHAHEISKLGCRIFCDFVIALLNGSSKELALESLKYQNYKDNYSKETISLYSKVIDGSIKNTKIDNIKSSGFVVDSLEASIWCTLNSTSYEDAVVKAINLGNDTDTIGAITGGINGIIYGKENIPTRWLNKLKKLDYLEKISEEYSETFQYKSRKNR